MLLLGPMYHLTERQDRMEALKETRWVVDGQAGQRASSSRIFFSPLHSIPFHFIPFALSPPRRLLKPKTGRAVVAVISRYASLTDGLQTGNLFTDEQFRVRGEGDRSDLVA